MGKRQMAESAAAEVEQSPAVAIAASIGHVVNGVVHLIIGFVAIGVARGIGGSADQSGALRAIDSTPLGSLGLWTSGAALWALGAYSIAVAIGELRSRKKEAARHGGRAVGYAVVGTMALIYANGGTTNGEETAKSASAQLMATTWGSWLLGLVGVVVFGFGVGLIVGGVRQTFLKDVDVVGTARRAFTLLGTTGYLAKGLSIAIVGVLFVVAVLTRNPEEAGGLDGALKKLAEMPFGTLLLVLVGVGLMMYGAFCFARARATARKATH